MKAFFNRLGYFLAVLIICIAINITAIAILIPTAPRLFTDLSEWRLSARMVTAAEDTQSNVFLIS